MNLMRMSRMVNHNIGRGKKWIFRNKIILSTNVEGDGVFCISYKDGSKDLLNDPAEIGEFKTLFKEKTI